jgi:hypothetical protein
MRGAMNENSQEAHSYMSPKKVAQINLYGEEQAQPQEQARGQRVTTESNKDIEATKLNATVEGLGFFVFSLGQDKQDRLYRHNQHKRVKSQEASYIKYYMSLPYY